MRALLIASTLLLTACAATPTVTPRAYLDEQTAATITVVADPWIFTRENAPPQADFLHLYAIDVNRMGDHKKYLAALHYWPSPEFETALPALELRTPQGELKLVALETDARQLGIAEPLDKTAPKVAKWWFYPLDKTTLEALARTRDLSAALTTGESRATYSVWRDGSAQVSEFASTAP